MLASKPTSTRRQTLTNRSSPSGSSAASCSVTTTGTTGGTRIRSARRIPRPWKDNRDSGSGACTSRTTGRYDERLTTRFRLEANSNGQFDGGNLEPYVKDAYLKWTYRGQQQLTLGIQPSLTFDWLEGFWGLRHIEKTPADLYRIDSSRDFGVTLSGPVAVDGLRYGVQFGNDSGNGSEVNVNKAVRIEGRFERKSGLAVEGFYGYMSRPEGESRHTAQAFAGFRRAPVRAGAQFLWQERQSGDVDAVDQIIHVQSGFLVWDIRPMKADAFVRVDRVTGDRGGVETGLPVRRALTTGCCRPGLRSRRGSRAPSGTASERSRRSESRAGSVRARPRPGCVPWTRSGRASPCHVLLVLLSPLQQKD